jgi:MHS family citrate/tricarballylate:H+ symporter-like MFS transporter
MQGHSSLSPGSPAALDATPGVQLPVGKAMAVGIGNALEFYDFLAFSYFAIQIGHVFFPASQTSHGLLWSLATFGIGFIPRPLGAIVIGRFGDRVGRKPAMMLSFSLMGASILGLALTPSYAQIGMAAPILLLTFRLIQGFALGGEVGPSTAFLIEAAPPGRQGLYVALQYSTQGVAILSAGLVGFFVSSALSPEALESWGWRAAFLVGAAVVPVGLYIRANLPETLHASEPRVESGPRPRVSVLMVVLALLMLGSNTIGTYTMNYMNTYAQDTLNLLPHIAFGATIVMGICLSIAAPIGGWLADRIGARPVMLGSVATMLVLVVPGYLLLNELRTAPALYTLTAIISFANQLACVGVMAAIAQNLPKSARSAGIAMLYAGAVATFGGSAQFIVKLLTDITGSPIAPAWYLTGALVIGALAMSAFRGAARSSQDSPR